MAKRNGHHWHLLSRGPLAPFNTSTTGTNMFFQLKVRLNIHISLTGMSHQMVFIFCARIFARILNSHIAWHSRKITVA